MRSRNIKEKEAAGTGGEAEENGKYAVRIAGGGVNRWLQRILWMTWGISLKFFGWKP